MLSNRLFDVLKWVAIVCLPALSTFITAVFPLWGIPNHEAIAQTITAFATFLGALLCLSSIQYKANKELGEE